MPKSSNLQIVRAAFQSHDKSKPEHYLPKNLEGVDTVRNDNLAIKFIKERITNSISKANFCKANRISTQTLTKSLNNIGIKTRNNSKKLEITQNNSNKPINVNSKKSVTQKKHIKHEERSGGCNLTSCTDPESKQLIQSVEKIPIKLYTDFNKPEFNYDI